MYTKYGLENGVMGAYDGLFWKNCSRVGEMYESLFFFASVKGHVAGHKDSLPGVNRQAFLV